MGYRYWGAAADPNDTAAQFDLDGSLSYVKRMLEPTCPLFCVAAELAGMWSLHDHVGAASVINALAKQEVESRRKICVFMPQQR